MAKLVNKTLVFVAREVAIRLAKKQLMAFLVSKLPFLGWFGINPILGFFIGKLVTLTIDKTILGANLLMLTGQIKKDVSKMNKARDRAIKAAQTGDLDAIEKSDEELIKAADNLIRTDHAKLR